MEVYGFGKKTTPEPFRVACNKFIYTEVLMNNAESIESTQNPTQSSFNKQGTDDKQLAALNPKSLESKSELIELKMLFREAFSKNEDDGWAYLADIGSYIQRVKPDFDARNYSAGKKLSSLVKTLDYIETENRNGLIYVKFKDPD